MFNAISYISVACAILLPSIAMIIAAFLYGLFSKVDRKVLCVLRFVLIGYAALVVCFAYFDLLPLLISPPLIGAMILTLFKSNKKRTLVLAWVVTAIVMTLHVLLIVMPVSGVLFYLFGRPLEHVEYDIFVLIICLLLISVYIGFMVAATVIITKRKNNYVVDNEEVEARKSRVLVIGNILAIISFMAFIIGIRYLAYSIVWHKDYSDELEYYNKYGSDVISVFLGFDSIADYIEWLKAVYQGAFAVTGIALGTAMVCGIISFFMFRHVRKEEADFTAMDTALYIWSWVPVVVSVVAIIVAVSMIFFFVGGGGDSHYKEAGTREATDEKGKKHKLDYKGGDSTEAVDESGEVWVTNDGGQSFRKRDLYVYEDPNGKREYMRDPYGAGSGTPTQLVDKSGTEYSYERHGVLKEQRLENYDDGSPREIIETWRISNSEERKATVVDDDK